MPVVRVGLFCGRCGVRPALWDGRCGPCWMLLRAFGRLPVVESDSLAVCNAILMAESVSRAEGTDS